MRFLRGIKEVGNVGISAAVRHPILTTAAIVILAAVSPSISNAQTKDLAGNSGKPVAGLMTGGKGEEKSKAREENKLPVRYENGIKIVGQKTFDVEIKNDSLYITRIRIGEGRLADMARNLDDDQKLVYLVGNMKSVVYATFENSKQGAYLIFEMGIAKLIPKVLERAVEWSFVYTGDNSKIFTHEGAMFVAPNSSIVATTPTTLLVITPTSVLSVTYEALFGKIPAFKKPNISGGRNPNEAFIRDETMRDASGAVRLELDLTTLRIYVAEDRFKSVPPETRLWRERADSSRPVRADSAVRVPVH
jgi:hypothetical protein